jgi:putative transcriptional regulator
MYQHRECGLRNVYLANGFTETVSKWGKAVAIDDVDGLHALIGSKLVQSSAKLKGAEVRFLRKALGLSQKALADLMACEEQTVSLWERENRITAPADRLLRALYMEHQKGSVAISKMLETLRDQNENRANEKLTLEHRLRWKVAV